MSLPVRRTLLLTTLGTLLLASCGFELRGTPELPFSRIALEGFAVRSPLAEELRRALAQGAEVVPATDRAQVVLRALTDTRERGVVASTADGQVRELQLRVRLTFLLSTPAGAELIPQTELLLTRDMSYSESLALAKEYEEVQLYRAMQSDIVSQVMRRLSRVKLTRS